MRDLRLFFFNEFTPFAAGNGMSVTLGPMEIRTFMCTTAPQVR